MKQLGLKYFLLAMTIASSILFITLISTNKNCIIVKNDEENISHKFNNLIKLLSNASDEQRLLDQDILITTIRYI